MSLWNNCTLCDVLHCRFLVPPDQIQKGIRGARPGVPHVRRRPRKSASPPTSDGPSSPSSSTPEVSPSLTNDRPGTSVGQVANETVAVASSAEMEVDNSASSRDGSVPKHQTANRRRAPPGGRTAIKTRKAYDVTSHGTVQKMQEN